MLLVKIHLGLSVLTVVLLALFVLDQMKKEDLKLKSLPSLFDVVRLLIACSLPVFNMFLIYVLVFEIDRAKEQFMNGVDDK